MKKIICICLMLGIVTGCADRGKTATSVKPHPIDKEVHKLPPVKPNTENPNHLPDVSFEDAVEFYFSLHDEASIITEIAYRPLHEEGVYEVKAAIEDSEVEIVFNNNHDILSETNEYLDHKEQVEFERDGFTRDELETIIPVSEAMHQALTFKPGHFVEVELKKDKDTLVYEIEIVGAHQKSIDIKVDAITGKVLRKD